MMKIPTLPLLVASLTALSPIRAEDAVTFLVGPSLSSLDEFPGGAGNGWEDGWKVLYPSGYERYFVMEVTPESPLPGTPGRLVIRNRDNAPRQTLLRRLPSPAVVSDEKPYVVTFKMRVDSVNADDAAVSFSLFCQAEGGTQGPGSSIWNMTVQNGRWCAVGRQKDGSDLVWHRFPIRVEVGVVYTFRMEVSPAEGTYRASVSSDAQHAESPELHFPVGEVPPGNSKEIMLRAGSPSSFVFSVAGLEIRPKE